MLLTIDEAKLHCRIDHDLEDDALQTMMDTATVAVADYLNMEAEDIDADAPAPVKSAALLLVADLYENRERQSSQALHRNDTFERLLNPYRVMLA